MRTASTDLQPLTAAAARALEPELRCVAAYLSPSTGVVDSHAFMLALQGDAESHGAMVAFNCPVTGGAVRDDGIVVATGGAEPLRVLARTVVNSGGLHAQRIAAALAGFPPAHVPPTYYAKGNYYSLLGKSPFSRLVYPMPNDAGLGVHITIDLGGQARFGPDVEWIERIGYDVDPRRADGFYAAIREYWPGLRGRRSSRRVLRDPPEDRRTAGQGRATSSSPGRARTACPASSISSASSRPG